MASYSEIKNRHDKLKEKLWRCRKIEIDEFSWGKDEFQKWQNTITKCFYCDTSEVDSERYYNAIKATRTPWGNKNGMSTRGKTLEIDRFDSMKGYSEDNCRRACYYCNNAKSDVFSGIEFKTTIAPAIAAVIKAKI